MDYLLSLSMAAEASGVPRGTLRARVKSGLLAARKINGFWFVRLADVKLVPRGSGGSRFTGKAHSRRAVEKCRRAALAAWALRKAVGWPYPTAPVAIPVSG